MERLFDRFFGPGFPFPRFFETAPITETEWAPSLDLSETDKEYVARVEAPGVHKENMDVNLDGNVLTVSGKRETRMEKEEEEYIWKEREEGRFVRSIRLPKAVDPDKVDASYQDGVLTIRLPKREPALKSKVAIK